MAWPRNDNRTLVEIYRTLAIVHLYTGEEDRAFEDLARVLNIDLSYQLPKSSAAPLLELMARVRVAYDAGHLKPVRVAHDPPIMATPGAPVLIAATISNLDSSMQAFVRYRRRGGAQFSEIALQARPGNRFGVEIPGQPLARGEREFIVEYYIEIRDALGHRVQGRGSAISPLSYLVEGGGAAAPRETKRGWIRSPWVWTALGVVAVGTATGIVIAASRGRGATIGVGITLSP